MGREFVRCLQVFGGEPVCKETSWKTYPWKEDKIKMDFKEMWRADVDFIDRCHDIDKWRAIVDKVMNFPSV